MRRGTKIIHGNGMVTYCLPHNPDLEKYLQNNRRRRHVEKIENFIEDLDNKDACVALRVLLHKHRHSKKVRRIIDAEKGLEA